tara:strand:+ start:94 stop:336 length:243 start_codon:yes stop_codon:yes gene_type:complete
MIKSKEKMKTSGTRKNTTLRWIIENGETHEDRHYAEKKYLDKVLSLWISYVNYSGDTYYPPLQKELFLDFQIHEEEQSSR